MNDIERIYNELKDKHKLLLTNTFALNDRFTCDVPVIYGEAEQGRFWLYEDKDVLDYGIMQFVFLVEYKKKACFRKRLKTFRVHWHPETIGQAIEEVNDFMTASYSFMK